MLRNIPLIIMLLLAAAFVAPTVEAPAQNRTTRLQRLKEHERKIQEIIKQRRIAAKEKEEEERAEEIEKRRSGEEIDETPQQEEDQPSRAISNVVMGLKFLNEEGDTNYNTIVRAGETFLTEVYLFNVDQNPIDRIRLALDFDKRFIEPLRVFDTSVRPFVEGQPDFRIDERDAVILYKAELSEPIKSPEAVLLRILWKAKRPTEYTGIEFSFSELEREEEYHTAMYVGDSNILGVADDPADGVLSGGLMIQKESEKQERLQGKAQELQEIYLGSVASEYQVGLALSGPERAPRVGEDFLVKVRLNNPDGALVDSVNFALLFDPTVLQVVDRDQFNYIIRGINVHDGPFHESFPWDMHKRNEVRNDRGLVRYEMAMSNGASLASETFAQVQFRAIAPTSSTSIGFVKGRPGAPDMTSVRYFGYERLDLTPGISQPAVQFSILPAPRNVAAKEKDSSTESDAVQSEDLQVRDLTIER